MMTKEEHETRMEAIRTDPSLSIKEAFAAMLALDAEAGIVYESGPIVRPALSPVVPLTAEEDALVDAAQAATEAEQARLDRED